MEKRYIIEWKDKTGERSGKGKKFFTREEAERLAAELNQDYPNFEHEAVRASSDHS